MRLWGYYARRTFINSIKKIFKSTFLIVVVSILAVFILMGVIGGVIGYTFAESMFDEESTEIEVSSEMYASELDEDYDEDYDEELNPEDEVTDLGFIKVGKTAECDITGAQFFEIIVMLVIVAFIMWGIYSGTKNGSDIFLMADVNLMFTAPMKPQSVMLFRLSFQMAAAFVASLYMLAQIPNLINGFGLKALGIVALMLGWVMLLILSRIFSVFTYTICSAHEKLKAMVVPIVIGIAAITVCPAFLMYTTNGGNIAAIAKAYSANWIRFIPIVGWYKGMIGYALEDNLLMYLVFVGLMLIGFAAMVAVVWNIKADFYESALSGAKTRQEMLEKKQNTKPKKVKHSKRESKEYSLSGKGAGAFFSKEMLLYRRYAFGGIVSTRMVIYAGIIASVNILIYRAFEYSNFAITAIILLVIVYFAGLESPIASDTNTTWLFLVPENPYKKLFALMGADLLKLAINMLPSIIIASAFSKENVGIVILWYITILAVNFMLESVRLMIDALVPSKGMDTIKSMVQAILKMLVLVILVVAFAVGFLIASWFGALIINLILAVVVGGLLFAIYPSMLHNGIG